METPACNAVGEGTDEAADEVRKVRLTGKQRRAWYRELILGNLSLKATNEPSTLPRELLCCLARRTELLICRFFQSG
jgi:hypothetical protein